MTTIINYNLGNPKSIKNMLAYLGIESRISSDHAEIASADRLILPGVGHFQHGMAQLQGHPGDVQLHRRRVGQLRYTGLLGLLRGNGDGVQPCVGKDRHDRQRQRQHDRDRPQPLGNTHRTQ